ncbi:long-chain-fatty-acid--CoA ligase [Kordiimonas sediminis]|uniref:3-methylmercaptopropionyl-CoA ligase n=1 Tax=Kordiimonas sediminis TaxID=1735581 RepID=A0A919AVI3_9PROT|nr:AMP-binding protein [Kordiimonas sediminis]GHF26820.1 long-chain-fatty-acid--CoA ligase [Kordiimonas sediminis]
MIIKGEEFTDADMLASNAGNLIDICVERNPHMPCVSCVLPSGHHHTLTYAEVGRLSDAMAVFLREELKLNTNDVIAIQSLNMLAYPVVAFGAFKAGIKITNINPLYTPEETQHQLQDSKAKILFVVDLFGDKLDSAIKDTDVEKVFSLSLVDLFPTVKAGILKFAMKRVKKIIPEASVGFHGSLASILKIGNKHLSRGVDIPSYRKDVTLDDTLIYQYTGGTTGRSKGAELTHRNIVSNISQAKKKEEALAEETNETLLLVLPLYHVYALAVGMISGMYAGGHMVLVPVPRPLSNLKPVFETFDITILPGVNTLFLGLLEEEWFKAKPPTTLKYCYSGAAPLQTSIAQEWSALTNCKIFEGYGLTESTCMVATMPLDRDPKIGTCGKAAPGTELKVTDEAGNILPVGEAGELWVRGPQVMKGYLNQPEATQETIVDGWLKTGDVAVIDDEGYLKIVDRIKDMVIVSGFNVYPTEVEDALMMNAAIAEAAVVGVSDDHTGEKLIAYVIKADQNLTEQDVIDHCREHLTGYKVPKVVVMIDEMPKSPVGKVLRRELRDQAIRDFAS